MSARNYNLLILCTGNSARGIIAESLVNRPGAGRFTGYSAGSHPAGEVHPLARRVPEKYELPTDGLRLVSLERVKLQQKLDEIGRAKRRIERIADFKHGK